ncbi:MAG: hypothetical protein RLN60_02610 [Phycisphaerales bacterium]
MQRSTPLAFAILIAAPALASISPDFTRANPAGPTVIIDEPLDAEPRPRELDRHASLALGPAIPVLTVDEQPDETSPAISTPARATEPSAKPATDAVTSHAEPAEPAALPPAVRSAGDSIPLGQPRHAPTTEPSNDTSAGASMADNWLLRTAGALAVVIGLILGVRFLLQWIDAKTNGGSAFASGAKAPSGLVEVLARYTVSRGTKLLLLKIDARILVVSQTSGEMHTLSEITNPDEVASILIKSRDEEGESLAGQFTRILRGLENDPSVVDDPITPQSPRRALVSSQQNDDDDEGDGTRSMRDGASLLRDRLSRFGDLSA